MNLHFQMQREDALAFNIAFYNASPTYRRTLTRGRWILPIIMAACWIFTLSLREFEWTGTIFYIGTGTLWIVFFPAYYRKQVEKYCVKTIDEGSYSKQFGAYILLLSDEGVHSTSPVGTAAYPWAAIDRAEISNTHLLIFLTGPMGYSAPIKDIGSTAAREAFDYISTRTQTQANPKDNF